jgi:hypothetical protein
MRLWIISELHI